MSLLPDLDKFHAHLDECEQCRNRPFDLCQLGYSLLVRAALSAGIGCMSMPRGVVS